MVPDETKKSPVPAVAREQNEDGIVTLSTGYRARLAPVAATLIAEVAARIPDPQVPMVHLPEKGRDEPNPNDPSYLRELSAANLARSSATMDALVMFGVELADGLPEDESWLQKLKYLEKRKVLDLSSFDLKDSFDREFLFKRYIAVAAPDLASVLRRTGVTEEEISRAAALFPGKEARRGAGELAAS